MTVVRIFTNIYIFILCFFQKPEKLGSHTGSKWWPCDPDVEDNPNDQLTRWPNDPVLCLTATPILQQSTSLALGSLWLTINILGVTVDKNLSMNDHVSAAYHIRALHHTHSSVSVNMAKIVACALVASTMLTLFCLRPLRKHLQTPVSTEPPRPCRYPFSSILQSMYSPPAAPLAPH